MKREGAVNEDRRKGGGVNTNIQEASMMEALQRELETSRRELCYVA